MNAKKIKIIAVSTMLVDHVICQSFGPNMFCIRNQIAMFLAQPFYNNEKYYIGDTLHSYFTLSVGMIGRISAVLFFFLLANGFAHTKNVKNYILRLLGFGILAQIPYTLFDNGGLVPIAEMRFNIMFTMAAALFALWCFQKLSKKLYLAIPLVVLITLLTRFFDLEYSYHCIAYVFYFYYSKQLSRPKRGIIGILIVCLLNFWRFRELLFTYGLSAMRTILMYIIGHSTAVLICLTYNGQKGTQTKRFQYFFYLFYPAHLFVLGIIQALL